MNYAVYIIRRDILITLTGKTEKTSRSNLETGTVQIVFQTGAQLNLFNPTCSDVIFAIFDPGMICDWEVMILNRFDVVTKITV